VIAEVGLLVRSGDGDLASPSAAVVLGIVLLWNVNFIFYTFCWIMAHCFMIASFRMIIRQYCCSCPSGTMMNELETALIN
jgi:hypothetical protein